MANKWHTLEIDEVLQALKTSRNGLTEEEAKDRLKKFGYNIIYERKKRLAEIFLRQFKSFLIAILLIGAIISILVGSLLETFAILIILLINAFLGFIQEYRAEKAAEELKKLIVPKARVIRNGKRVEIPTKELVPGDVILVEAGEKIPADARLIEEFSLIVNESSLTGESTPVHKNISPIKSIQLAERSNMVFMGTVATYGRATAIVVNTGMNTEMGKIAKIVQEEKEFTPLQKKLDQFGKWLGLVSLFVCSMLLLLGFLRGLEFHEMLLMSIALAVSAVPEGLPAVVTVTLALATTKMAKKNALIRRLASVETLGCTTVICADKTGTMTTNEMTVRKIWYDEAIVEVSGIGFEPKGNFIKDGKIFDPIKDEHLALLLKAGVLCNNASLEFKEGKWRVIGDPTDGALIVLGKKAGMSREKFESPIAEIPFSSERKIMTTAFKSGEKIVAYTKGAPEKVLQLSSFIRRGEKIEKLTANEKAKIMNFVQEMASNGLRVLALAYKQEEKFYAHDSESDLIFLGFVGMIDPPRAEIKEAIEKCRQAGIKPIMLTGDHKLTAIAIAKEIGLIEKNSTAVLTGEELDKLSDEELEEKVENILVYARVSPQHKVRILRALKKRGNVVAMTGDGVNDAPALKKADIGVAMGVKGTDVAKEASDMILADDNFATIVKAVEEGRGVYGNIRKFIRFLLCTNLGEIALISVAILFGLPLPLLPLQILWLNLVTDGLPALALSVDPYEKDLMKKKPRNPKASVLHGMLLFILIGTLVSFLAGMSIFLFGLNWVGKEKAVTMVFTVAVFSELFYVFNCRSEKHSVFKLGIFGNKKLLLAVVLSFMLQLLVIYLPPLQAIFKTVPLEPSELFLVTFASTSALLVLPEIFMRRI